MTILTTSRLTLRRLTENDAPFIFRLVNEPSWLRFIGDKGVRSLDDARRYLREGPLAMYETHGFGLYLVVRNEDEQPIGMCGLIKREALPDIDVGFAYIPEVWGKGYAVEAARAVAAHARSDFGLKRLVAITSLDNDASIRVLERIGMTFEKIVEVRPGDPVRLFAQAF